MTIKNCICQNGQILLFFYFTKIIKKAWNQIPVPSIQPKTCLTCLSYSKLVFDRISFWYGLGFKRNKHKCNLHCAAMLMMTSQILKSAGFIKTQNFRYLEKEISFFLQIKKLINYTLNATLRQRIVL